MPEYVTDYPGFHPLQVQSSQVGASFSGRKLLKRRRGREKHDEPQTVENGLENTFSIYQREKGYNRSFEID